MQKDSRRSKSEQKLKFGLVGRVAGRGGAGKFLVAFDMCPDTNANPRLASVLRHMMKTRA